MSHIYGDDQSFKFFYLLEEWKKKSSFRGMSSFFLKSSTKRLKKMSLKNILLVCHCLKLLLYSYLSSFSDYMVAFYYSIPL